MFVNMCHLEKKLVYLTAFVILLVPLGACGRPNESPTPRIVGGVPAIAHEFPWLIHFVNRRSGTNICGGAILDHSWVVTAAHCFTDKIDMVDLVAGDHNQEVEEGSEQLFQLSVANRHPSYIYDEFQHDIALVKIDGSFIFNEFVQPIKLPAENSRHGGSVTISGWGITYEGSSLSPAVLMKVTVPVVDSANCSEYYGDIITDGMMCAGVYEGGKDSCNGDSGGPAICKEHGSEEIEFCGVVSFGKTGLSRYSAIPSYVG